MDFNHQEVEAKWKKKWADTQLYKVKLDTSKPKYYILDMFPYPSGAGLHVGHPLGYIASDIVARYKKQMGFNVLHPMGFDAFGLPAEQYAIQTGVHPAKSTEENIKMYRKQLDNIGFNYDWDRQVKTCDPNYYKWTQWIFTELYNYYYDVQADQAKPISELEKHFASNGMSNHSAYTTFEGELSAAEYNSLSAKEKDDLLMNFRLAYKKVGYVNYCPALGTVLANDEVKDGVSERGGHPVELRPMIQWSLRITAYAERLLTGMDNIDWPDSLNAMQTNWIGRSTGAQVFFDIKDHDEKMEIFTTRADTIFGATYMALAPEHELVDIITTPGQRADIDACIDKVKSKSERERMADTKDMLGAFTGSYAVNPFNNKLIPIWIADYVLKDYGTGAIMAVPSDDDRDKFFAEKYGLDIIDVVDKSQYPGASLKDKVGVLVNSEFLNGMEVPEAIDTMYREIEARAIGSKKINYRLRDANFSRQRYWGEPFPVYYDKDGVTHVFEEKDLPITLPDLDDYKPTPEGKSPLSRLEWTNFGEYTRETDTMPGFAGSSWYFLRYMDPENLERFASNEAIEYWQDVDFYIGGAEHAVGHLMYSRFWHKFLYDKGLVPTSEPFKKLVNQGMIQGVIESLYLLKSEEGQSEFYSAELAENMSDSEFAMIPVFVDFVSNYGSKDSHLDNEGIKKFVDWRPDYKKATFHTTEGTFKIEDLENTEIKMNTKSEVGKMSKRYYNVVNPDDMVEKYGADCFRMYEMFLGPIEQSKPWDTKGIDGVSKFLRKLWNLAHDHEGNLSLSDEAPNKDELKTLHTAIKKLNEDIEKLSLNTSVSTLMIAVNELTKAKCRKKEVIATLAQLIAPFAPFISEELWSITGHEQSVHLSPYPQHDEKYLVEDEIVYPLCIKGKKKDEMAMPAGIDNDEIQRLALTSDKIKNAIGDSTVRKVIIVPGRMVNIVI